MPAEICASAGIELESELNLELELGFEFGVWVWRFRPNPTKGAATQLLQATVAAPFVMGYKVSNAADTS